MKKYWIYQRVWKNLKNNKTVVDISLYNKCCKNLPRYKWLDYLIMSRQVIDHDRKINWMHYDLIDTVWIELKGGECYE